MWKHKQSSKWIISHAGVEVIAAAEGIRVEYATEYLSPDFVVLRAKPVNAAGEPGQETFGEAGKETTRMGYYVAMAEKRAYDRAVLKMALASVGAHGADFYSDQEADEFKRDQQTTSGPAKYSKPEEGVGVPVKFAEYTEALAGTVDPAAIAGKIEGLEKKAAQYKWQWAGRVEAFANAMRALLAAETKDEVKAVYNDHLEPLGLADPQTSEDIHLQSCWQSAVRSRMTFVKEAA